MDGKHCFEGRVYGGFHFGKIVLPYPLWGNVVLYTTSPYEFAEGYMGVSNGFQLVMGQAPIAGLFHGKSPSKVDDDWGLPDFRKAP